MLASDDSYDLVANPWIPVIGLDGAPERVGLAELARRAGSLRALGGAPPVRIAVLRLIVAMLRDCLGTAPVAPDRRRQWWDRGVLPHEEFGEYLREHSARLRLFDARQPFLQDPRLREDRTPLKSVAELAPHLPTGNNATMTRQTTDLGGSNPARFPAADAACWIVSIHAHVRPGITVSRGAVPPGRVSGRGGPLLGRLAAVPECGTLARTLLLNLPPGPRDPLDVPAYRAAEAVRPGEQARGPVSVLTWTSRHVLLVPNPDGTVTEAKVAVDSEVDPLLPRAVLAEHDPHLLAAARPNPTGGWTLAAATTDRLALADAALIARHSAFPAPGSVIPAAIEASRGEYSVWLSVYGLSVESTSKFTGWTVSSVPCANHASAQAAVNLARIAAEAAGEAAAAAEPGSRSPERADRRRAVIRARTAAIVWRSLDARGRVLLGRLAAGPIDQDELAQWYTHCARAARTALRESCHAAAYAPSTQRAKTRLEFTLASALRTLEAGPPESSGR
jgi:CRISPR-associated protein Cse1 family